MADKIDLGGRALSNGAEDVKVLDGGGTIDGGCLGLLRMGVRH